jgi:hypothetical protein
MMGNRAMVAVIAHFDDRFSYRYIHTYRLHTHTMKALLVIDMQNDFCLPDAILCVKQGMQCLPKVQEAVSICREKQHYVIWVIRSHDRQGAFSEKLSSTDLQRVTFFSYTTLHSNPQNPTPTPSPLRSRCRKIQTESIHQRPWSHSLQHPRSRSHLPSRPPPPLRTHHRQN